MSHLSHASDGVTSTVARPTRGPTRNPQGNWSAPGMPKSVIRLSVDTSDPVMRRRVEQLYSAAFQVRRAVQCDARSRIDAYWAAQHERARDPKSVRKRLGLSRKGLEAAAQQHLDAAPHLGRWCSKALGLHRPTPCGSPSAGTCTPTGRASGRAGRGSPRGGTSPGSRVGPAPTPRPTSGRRSGCTAPSPPPARRCDPMAGGTNSRPPHPPPPIPTRPGGPTTVRCRS
jgi:hypothetical protein